MMDFAPLKWVAGTLTLWHLGIFGALAALLGGLEFQRVQSSLTRFDLGELTFSLAAFAFLYVVGALVLGQVFGDKYGFALIWPTSAVLGVVFSFLGVAYFAKKAPMPNREAGYLFLFFAITWGLTFNLFLYVLPRMVGWFGRIEFPKASWGVTLLPSP